MAMTLQELAVAIHAELRPADPTVAAHTVSHCATLAEANEQSVAFLANPRYTEQVQTTRAAAVIVGRDVEVSGRTLLVADDPYFAFRNACVALHGFRTHPLPADGTVSARALVDPSATLGPGCIVHPFAVISANVTLGRDCVVYPHTFIGPNVTVGDECQLYPSVTVYDGCVIGHRVTLHAGCVIGQDGFGYATATAEHDQFPAHHKIPQSGNVVIEDDVEMGANCSVDRATVGSTVIGRGTKFSNSVTIGHGCRIGRHNLCVGQVGLAGSVTTGDYCALGGQVGIAGHLTIGNKVQIAATSAVMNDIPDDQVWGGSPAMRITEAKRIHLHTLRLPDLVARIKKLERQIEKMKK